MGEVIEVTSAGAILGPFGVYPGRPFGAWLAVLDLDGATSVTATAETGEDAMTWTVAEVGPVVNNAERGVVYVAAPERYVRLLVAVTAPGAWSGSVRCAYAASSEAWDVALVDAAAREDAARYEAAVAEIRAQLGIDAYLAESRRADQADPFLPTRPEPA